MHMLDVMDLPLIKHFELRPYTTSGAKSDHIHHPGITMKLTPEYAQRLFEIGAFVIFSDLPAGTEVGIDGEYV
jgi:hypothetical protein